MIDWHKYPETHPESVGEYLVWATPYHFSFACMRAWDGKRWNWSGPDVTHWAEVQPPTREGE